MCAVERGQNSLCLPAVAPRLIEIARSYHDHLEWYCRHLVLMPDHLHAIAAFPSDVSMAKWARKFKIYTARETGVRWQRDFFDHRLRYAEEVRLKSDYVLQNPVRAGLAAKTEEWLWRWSAASSGLATSNDGG